MRAHARRAPARRERGAKRVCVFKAWEIACKACAYKRRARVRCARSAMNVGVSAPCEARTCEAYKLAPAKR
eukprot:4220183-Pleurochrysis_carterae.AAC.1